MPKVNDRVKYQGYGATVINVMGTAPHQVLTIRFDDGKERTVTASEITEKEKNLSPSQGQNAGMSDYEQGMSTGSIAGRAETGGSTPPLGEGNPEPPLKEDVGDPPPYGIDITDQTPNDAGPGTGDSGAGLKADGKDVDSARRRLLGTEEIVVYIEPVTRKVVDANGRTIRVGDTVSIAAKIVGFKGAKEVEILYPPHVPANPFPVYNDKSKRLEMADAEGKPNGTEYTGGMFTNDNGTVKDASGNPPPRFEPIKQNKLTIKVDDLRKF
jgi:hypothetical protein